MSGDEDVGQADTDTPTRQQKSLSLGSEVDPIAFDEPGDAYDVY
jgi:hypothetical protein